VSWQSEADATEGTSGEAALSIGEVCRRTGLSPRTVRYYEELGLLPGVRRRTGGRRVYGDDELDRLRFIQRLKALGLSLQEIKELNSLYAIGGSTHAMLERLAVLLDAHLAGVEGRIAQLVELRDQMRRYRERVARRIGTGRSEGDPDGSEAEPSRSEAAPRPSESTREIA
jgi:DNA-binding transcriptional MerR regulator